MRKDNAIVRVIGGDVFYKVWQKRKNTQNKRFASTGANERSIDEIMDYLVGKHPLDENKDQPLPEWAVKILRDETVGFRWRVKIVLSHNLDITGENPHAHLVQDNGGEPRMKDMVVPKWLDEYRERKRKQAEEYMKKKGIIK